MCMTVDLNNLLFCTAACKSTTMQTFLICSFLMVGQAATHHQVRTHQDPIPLSISSPNFIFIIALILPSYL